MRFAEANLFGVYIATMSVMLVAAWLITIALRRIAGRFGLLRHVWPARLCQRGCKTARALKLPRAGKQNFGRYRSDPGATLYAMLDDADKSTPPSGQHLPSPDPVKGCPGFSLHSPHPAHHTRRSCAVGRWTAGSGERPKKQLNFATACT